MSCLLFWSVGCLLEVNQQNYIVMKNYSKIKKNAHRIILIISSLVMSFEVFAQGPPPPPGVPLDFGISALIAACIGYGVVKMKKNKED